MLFNKLKKKKDNNKKKQKRVRRHKDDEHNFDHELNDTEFFEMMEDD